MKSGLIPVHRVQDDLEEKQKKNLTLRATVFENHRKKSLIQHCERSELRLHLIKNAKNGQFGEFLKKTEACGQKWIKIP